MAIVTFRKAAAAARKANNTTLEEEFLVRDTRMDFYY